MNRMNNFKAEILSEPELLFAYGQKSIDPKDGLGLFGPYDLQSSSQPRTLSCAVIGTKEGIEMFSSFYSRITNAVISQKSIESSKGYYLWTPFPGFEVITGARLPQTPAFKREVSFEDLESCSRINDAYTRVSNVVKIFVDEIEKLSKRDEKIDVVICVVPEIVFMNCRIKSNVQNGIGDKPSRKDIEFNKAGQLDLFKTVNFDDYKYSLDFRRQIKAKSMKFKMPIQIIRETSLALKDDFEKWKERDLTPLSDRAWNISTTLYYKSGGKPWKLASAREGVCYLGMSFRRSDNNMNSRTACCAAQMFLDSGDGIVFLGEYGPWYSPEDKEFHLSRDAARKLIAGALNTYENQEGIKLKELFIHSHSSINEEEFAGFCDGAPDDVKVIGIRIRKNNNIKLYRTGEYPVLRGTYIELTPKSSLLWASGFKTRLGTYDGHSIPIPLKIDIQHGDANIYDVTKDIFALTKLNYNTCKLGESYPVTIKFSDAIGEILVDNPKTENPCPNFKFYI